MGLGNGNSKEGDKGSNYSYELKHLQGLQQSLVLLGGLATEATLQLVLSAIQDGQDFEAKLIEDTNGATFLEVRIWNPDTQTWEAPLYYPPGSNTGYNVGDPGGPVAPIVYINPSSVLNQIYTELLDQGLSLDQIDLNTDDVATQTTLAALLAAFNAEDFATQTTLAALLAAFNAEDFATQTTLAALLTELQLKADLTETQPVSAVSLPLPTGAATEATLLQIDADTGAILVEILKLSSDIAAKTPTSVVSTGVTNIPVGATEISIFNNGTGDGTVNGVKIPAGVTRTFGFKNPTSAIIVCNGGGTEELIIDYMV